MVMVKAGIAAKKERAANLLDIIRMPRAQNYKVQATLGLPNCPRKVAHAILDTGAGPKLTRLELMDPPWRADINHMKPQRLRSAAGTILQVAGSVRLETKIGQRVVETGLLVVENLAVDVLLGTAFIDANVELISPGKQLMHPIESGLVAIMSTGHEENPIATVGAVEEQSIVRRLAKVTVITALLQAPVMV